MKVMFAHSIQTKLEMPTYARKKDMPLEKTEEPLKKSREPRKSSYHK